MESSKKVNQLRPYHGIIVFILVILMTVFAAAPIQRELGMYGVAITELMILLLGLAPAIFLKTDLREIFPVKRPLFRQIIGTFIIWIGSYLAVMLITLIIGYFFPDGLTQVSNGLQDITTSVPAGIAFIIIAIMPAVCEEILHRGFILSSLYSLKNKWIIVMCMGIIFGIFHLDFYRFLPTAVLGMALTYIMIETRNLILPALFHFFNNGLSTFVSFMTKSQTEALPKTVSVPLVAIAAYLIIGTVIPFVLLLGARLIRKEGDGQVIAAGKRGINKAVWAAVICSVIIALAGAIAMVFSIKGAAPVFETNITMDVNHDSNDLQFPMKIEKSGDYTMDLELINDRGLIEMKILSESGKEVFGTSCMWSTSTNSIELKEGTYQVVVKFHIDDMEEYCKQMGIIYDEGEKQKLKMTGDLYEYLPFKMKIVIR